MRVLYILPQPFLLPRGSSFRADATLQGIVELGHQVDLLCYDLGADPPGRGYAIHRAWRPPGLRTVKIGPSPAKILLDIPLYTRARAMVRATRYDVLHGVEEAGFIAARLGVARRIPYIYDMHSWMSQQIEGTRFGRWKAPLNAFRRMEHRAMNGATAILTVGDTMTRLLRTQLAPGVHSATLPDCPLPFDLPPAPGREEAIVRECFSSPRKTLLYTGNFHVYQGLDLLLDSIRELKALVNGRFDFALLIVGGSAAEKPLVDACRRKVAELGIAREVVFRGECPPEEIPVYLRHADLLVSSRVTGNNVPLKIYTYLASGVPLAATRVPSHTQVLNDTNCLLGDPEPNAFARTLLLGLEGLTEAGRSALLAGAAQNSPAAQWEVFRTVLKECYDLCAARPSRRDASH